MDLFETNENGDKLVDLDYLLFGIFSSDNYGAYVIYKLTKNELLADRSESWHNYRHKSEGYTFVGQLESIEKYNTTKELLFNVPVDILDKSLKGFYTTGNKNEDKFIIEVSSKGFKKSVTIDSYETETDDLPINLKNFRLAIEEKIKELKG